MANKCTGAPRIDISSRSFADNTYIKQQQSMFYINSLNILHKIRVAKNTKGFLPAELSSIFVFSGALLTREVEFQA